jgi:hypothetical protein
MHELVEWQTFYEIMGSCTGALIGLQFVALSLITQVRARRVDPEAGNTYATPTIVHYATVLGISGIVSAPWKGFIAPSTLWGVVGAVGLVYIAIILRRMRVHPSYRPELEDWLFHVLLPLAAYALLAGSAYAAHFRLHEALFAVGAAALLLLYTGIHNTWDAVTYHLFGDGAINQPQPGAEK